MNKRLAFAAFIAAIAALNLSGCYISQPPPSAVPPAESEAPDSGAPTTDSNRLTVGVEEFRYTLNDGREIVCLLVYSGNRSGTSCDWGNAE
jgi:hypothetical protein